MDRQALRTFGFDTLPDAEGLQKRYRELLFAHHPDRTSDSSVRAARKTAEIVAAYRKLQQQLRDRAGRILPDEQIFQLIESEPYRLALPIQSVIGFVRVQETEIKSHFFSAIAHYQGRSYIIYSPRGGNVSAARCSGWLLLLSGSRRSAVLFTKKPDRIRFSSLTEGMLLGGNQGTTFVLAGQQYRIPASVTP